MEKTRKGCKDIWNAFMLKGARFDVGDIPFCDSTGDIPHKIVAYDLTKSYPDKDCYVHFYIDDQKFDGPNGIWHKPYEALNRLKQYKGVITPDFSTYQDMPDPIKRYNTYRMRAFGYWLNQNGVKIINNVRFGSPETYDYCFSGIPKNSIICIGTIGCVKRKKDWYRLEQGLDELIRRLSPKILLVYGSVPEKLFKKISESGIIIKEYLSQTAIAFGDRNGK